MTWSACRGCSAMHAPRNPSNTQPRRDAEAARKRRPILTKKIPLRISTVIVKKKKKKGEEETQNSVQPRDARQARCRRQMPRRSLRPAASWHSSQPHECFDMKCLREEVEQMHFRDFITDARPGDFLRFSGRACQNCQIASKCGWIAGKIHNLVGT